MAAVCVWALNALAILTGVLRDRPWQLGYGLDIFSYLLAVGAWLPVLWLRVVWTFRVAGNVKVLVKRRSLSPRLAAALQLVPLVNWFTTFPILVAIWRASGPAAGGPALAMIFLAWIFYVLAGALSLGGFFLSEGQVFLAAAMDLAYALLVAPLDLLLIWIVTRISEMQRRAYADLAFS